MTTASMDRAIWGVLCDAYGRLRNGSKQLARDAGGRSPETARKWLSGRAEIPSTALLQVMRNNRELRTKIVALAEADGC